MYWLDPDTSFKLNVFCHLEMSLESPFSDVSLRNPNIAQVFLSQYLNSWTCLTDKAWPILPFSPLESERNDISRFENGDCTRTRSRVPWLFRVQPKHQKRLSPDADNRKYAQTRLAQYCDQIRFCNATLRRSPPVYSLAWRLRNAKVPVWTHESIGYPKMDISHWDAAIHFGVQLAQYCDQTRTSNAISRRSPPVYSLALRLRNTTEPVWTHESIGYLKIYISHWDAAIHYGIQLAQYCDQTRSFNAISRKLPLVYSLALRLRNTKIPVWTHGCIGYPKIDISHWHAAIHYGVQLAKYCDQTLSCNAISRRWPPLYSLALRLRNTKIPVWTHESIGYPKMDISHWDAAIHFGIQLAQYCDQTRNFNAISRRSPPVYSLALRLRNTKIPVWTHGCIGYPKIDISHWHAAIHYGVQLAKYCDQTLSCNAISRRWPPLYSLALRLRNTKIPVWTHESIGYPKMDISHWDAAIHFGIQLAQYCDQTRNFNAISRRSPPVYSLALRLRNTKVPVWTHESIGYPKMDISQFFAFRPFEWEERTYCYLCYAIG